MISVIEACTIIAANYIAAARVLAESFFRHHPDSLFSVLVVDDERRELTFDGTELDRRIAWLRLGDLGLDTAAIHRLAGIYDVTELSTAIKPLFLQCLLRQRQAPVIYLDPDIRIFSALDEVPVLAERHGLVLTPHITEPFPDDGREVDALSVLSAGVYNLGFIAVAPSAMPCLEWWWAQTRRRALNDVSQQMFTDQRWADYIPSLFSHHLLKDPGYNVAYWNLHERPVTRSGGHLQARNTPLRFFHFSGFDPKAPWLLSRHQGVRPRILLSEHPLLAELCDDYASALDAAGMASSSSRTYGWDVSADGLAMSRRVRRLLWSEVLAAESGNAPEPPDPFDPLHPDAFTAWLNSPDERDTAGVWSRYLRAIHSGRPDVQAHIRHIDGTDAARFADWLRIYGVVEEQIPVELMPPVSGPTPDAAFASSPAEGLNVAGYFHGELGVGEAARLLLSAIDATGSASLTLVHSASRSRQQHRFEARGLEARAPFDVNLLCVNADVTAEFAREAGPEFFANRYTIGYWFWEVDPLPPAMHDAFAHVDEVWTASDYVAGIVRAAAGGRVPVHTVPLPLMAPTIPHVLTRADLGLPADRFVFLFVFDFLSVVGRKNPLGAIEAFCKAFAPGEGPVLVLKSINGDTHVADLERLRRAAGHRADIVIRDGYLTADEKNALVAACDCYVSLHRAEGLGLTLAEAMSLGKPTIATGYSGNRHFMTEQNSFLVGYQRSAVGDTCAPYPADARWADPDLEHAAELMRSVYFDRCQARERAERGQADLLSLHNVHVSARAIAGRLSEIRRGKSSSIDPRKNLDAATRSAAFAAFAAALPELSRLSQPHLSTDDRSWQWLRRIAQRALFRVIKPYRFQQQLFQDALLAALHESLARLPVDGQSGVGRGTRGDR